MRGRGSLKLLLSPLASPLLGTDDKNDGEAPSPLARLCQRPCEDTDKATDERCNDTRPILPDFPASFFLCTDLISHIREAIGIEYWLVRSPTHRLRLRIGDRLAATHQERGSPLLLR